jgi:hypothetical protein
LLQRIGIQGARGVWGRALAAPVTNQLIFLLLKSCMHHWAVFRVNNEMEKYAALRV